MQTLAEFIKAHNLTLAAKGVRHNPNMEGSADMDHWSCRVVSQRSVMRVPFSKGKGHNGAAPELAEVLDCLASDAGGYENARDFADWCSEYGYDEDSRKAERVYNSVGDQAALLRGFLGDEAYKDLLWNTERE